MRKRNTAYGLHVEEIQHNHNEKKTREERSALLKRFFSRFFYLLQFIALIERIEGGTSLR